MSKAEVNLEKDGSPESGVCVSRLFTVNQYLITGNGIKSFAGIRRILGCQHQYVSSSVPFGASGTLVHTELGVDYSVKGATEHHPTHPGT
jgi:hypothetical protein